MPGPDLEMLVNGKPGKNNFQLSSSLPPRPANGSRTSHNVSRTIRFRLQAKTKYSQ